MAKLFNLARMTTATTGTGTITLGSAASGFLTFAQSDVADGDIVSYGIQDGTSREVGTGTYTSSGTTLTRTVVKSTNSNTAISLSGSAEVFITPLASDISSALAGRIEAYAGATAPTGYLLCDGTAVSRTTYAALFAVTSTTYGVGDGSTTFNVPDLRGRVPVGVGTNASVNARALSDGVAVANRRPQHQHTTHTHSLTVPGAVNVLFAGASQYQSGVDRPGQASSPTTAAANDGGSGVATDSLDAPAWLTVNYIISI
jgi:microcystin-dependent protein